MSRDTLGNNQTIIIHNCLINDERCDLVITPHKQSVGYIKTQKDKHYETKLLTIKNKLQIIRKRFIIRNEETQSQNQKQPQYKNFTI